MLNSKANVEQFDNKNAKHFFALIVVISSIATAFLIYSFLNNGNILNGDITPLVFVTINLVSLIFLLKNKIHIVKFIITFILPLSLFSNLINGHHSEFYLLWISIAFIGMANITFIVYDINKERHKIFLGLVYIFLLMVFSEFILWTGGLISKELSAEVFYNNLEAIKTAHVSVFMLNVFILFQLVYRCNLRQKKLRKFNADLRTEQLKLVEKLSSIDSRYNIINSLIDILITNKKGIITYANQRFCQSTQFKLEEIIGKSPRLLNSDFHSKKFFNELWATILSGNIWNGHIKNKRKDGTEYWVESIISPIFTKHKKLEGFLDIMFDITSLKEKEKILRNLNESKNEMISTVSHDLKTPINNIKLLIEMFFDAKIAENERDEVFELIINACDDSNKILEELLEISSLEQESRDIKMEKVNLNLFIIKVIKPFIQIFKESNLHIALDLSKQKIYAYINRDLFSRAITNIVTNAIKFTPSNGSISIKTILSAEGKIRILISDSGIGIPKNLQPYIFDKFSKAGRAGLKGEKSTGLGLSIVKHIINMHSGEVSFISSEKSGTTFCIDMEI